MARTISWHFIHDYGRLYANLIKSFWQDDYHLLIGHEQSDFLSSEKLSDCSVSLELLFRSSSRLPITSPHSILSLYDQEHITQAIQSEVNIRHTSINQAYYLLEQHLVAYETIFSKYRPIVHISEKPSILSTHAAYIVCRRLGIKFLSLSKLPIENKFGVSSNAFGFPDFLNQLDSDKILSNKKNFLDGSDYIDSFTSNPVKTSDILLKSKPPKITWSPKKILPFIRDCINFVSGKRYYLFHSPFHYQFENLSRIFKVLLWKYASPFDSTTDDLPRYYIYYALHRVREWSMYTTSPGFYGSEIELLKKIRQFTPPYISIVVKEHTGFYGGRKSSFYREIKSIGNVVLLPPTYSNWKLINSCLFTISLSGTTGFESLLFRKRSFLFGKSWYENLKGISKFRGWHSYISFVAYSIKNPSLTREESDVLKSQIGYILNESISGYCLLNDFNRLTKPSNLESLSKALSVYID